MVDETGNVGKKPNVWLDTALTSLTGSTKKGDQVGKDEFLQLLVTQLKFQDPESPMDSKEFAVQLAQFSQVEQLMKINDQLGNMGGDISSVAGYLGNYVVLDGSTTTVQGGNGGEITVDLGQNASDVKIELLDSNGEVVTSQGLGGVNAGKHRVSLKDISVPDGDYDVKVTALSSSTGASFSPGLSVTGMVTGIDPGPPPSLLVDGRKVGLDKVKEVSLPPKENSGTQQ